MTTRIPTMYGRYYVLTIVWRGREYDITVFRSKLQKLQRPQAQRIAQSIYPNSKVIKYHESDPSDGPVVLATESLRQAKKNIGRDPDKPSCWKGYKAKGTKMKGGKSVPNCVKEFATFMDEAKKGSKKKKNQVNDEDKHDAGNLPPAMGGPLGEGAAWKKKSGKNKEGGLNEKGRKSYEKENPGSDLKAPSKKKGNKRRASFCARMKGMKKKLTSKKTASDPDSRINKSLRAWNC